MEIGTVRLFQFHPITPVEFQDFEVY